MPTYLGHRYATGVLSPANRVAPGNWLVTFPPEQLPRDTDFMVRHMAIRGPGGYFLQYIDDTLYSVAENGAFNDWEPTQNMFVRKGQSLSFHWSIATGTFPQVWVYLQTPT